jgi:hypothetical protein
MFSNKQHGSSGPACITEISNHVIRCIQDYQIADTYRSYSSVSKGRHMDFTSEI